jgi:glycosyltransferase XagB
MLKKTTNKIAFDMPIKVSPSPRSQGVILNAQSVFDKHRELILYFMIGGTAAAIDFLLFLFFYHSLHIQSAMATMASILISTLYGFLMNTYVNFRTFDRLARRFATYTATSMLAVLLSGMLLYIFTDTMGIDGSIVKIVSLPCIAYIQYRLNRRYSFAVERKYRTVPIVSLPPRRVIEPVHATNKIDCTIIPPTFNEAKNVRKLVSTITNVFKKTPWYYEILFVDDSVDETPKIIKQLAKEDSRVRLIHREEHERTGLATAFVEGFEHAKGEIICCIDADLQHPPHLIPKLVETLKMDPGTSMAVASRYAPGGSEAGLDKWYRKVVSNGSKFITQLIFPATKKTGDPMTGFFAFRRKILRGITLRPRGFKILVEMLVRISHLKVVDIPMIMQKRFAGYTKASIKQGIAFFKHLLDLAKDIPGASIFFKIKKKLKHFFNPKRFAWIIATAAALYFIVKAYQISSSIFSDVLLTLALLQLTQGIFGLYLMIYAWDDPRRIAEDSSPKTYIDPMLSFTAVIPARHEASVIGQTIQTVASISYPRHLMETLVVLRDDDYETIEAAKIAIAKLPDEPVRILLISGPPINKPHHLNAALKEAAGDIVCIFDAEDEPHEDIYNIVNTVMLRDKVDVVQSGVQLMNFESNWYSMFNVLEYFLWFRSSLHFFAKKHLIPLGGTTVFFKRQHLLAAGGWDMTCLTEDAEIGIRLSLQGAKTRVIYDPVHVTKEETPPTLSSFIKQRTRWIQGFLQILKKPHWRKNQTFSKQFFTLYVIGWPALQAVLLFSIPFSIAAASILKVSPVISLISAIPLLILALFITTQAIALYEFTRLYHKKWSPWYIFKLILLYIPYQCVLGFSAVRATIREMQQKVGWEKTEHINAHRSAVEQVPAEKTSIVYQQQ